jgi:nucleotide-binding universal stress UspA family protein
MKPIVLATDGSPSAAAATTKAIDLAHELDAPLIVATIWQITYEPVGLAFGPVVPDLDSVGRERAIEIAAKAEEEARAAGVEVEIEVRHGIPGHEICAIANTYDAQLIVLGSHGWGAFRRLLFGSVSTAVLHHATQPVLVVPSRVLSETTTEPENVEV